jgi:cytidine deaminase
MMMNEDMLIATAKNAREKAYVPYSDFKVGAALRGKSGTVYMGCNIENASYSLGCCAERTAIFSAVSQGEKEFTQLVVIADTEKAVSPCGACRQVMAEFFTKDVSILLTNLTGDRIETNLSGLLPYHFQMEEG